MKQAEFNDLVDMTITAVVNDFLRFGQSYNDTMQLIEKLQAELKLRQKRKRKKPQTKAN